MRGIYRTIATLSVATVIALAPIATGGAQEKRVVEVDVVERTATGGDVETSGGIEVIRVTQGDQVEIRWTTDEATEVHLHGYDVTTKVGTDGAAVMNVNARAAGRFAIESHGFGADHHAEKTLIYLEVLPR